MLRTRLLTATAAIALFAAPAAFAQDAMTPAPQEPVTQPAPATAPAADPTLPATPQATAPTASATTSAQASTTATPAAGNTVVDVLRSNGQFNTLLSALDAAGLTETLSTQPAISIFAPTDAAFAALPEADRTRLMDPANAAELRQLLLYHVVVADVNSSQIEGAAGGVETAARSQVQLNGTGDSIMVDGATVVQADIDASNGAIFAIDQVLNPAASQAAMGDAEAVAPAATDATEAPVTEAPAADAAPAAEATPAPEAAPAADAMEAPAAPAPAEGSSVTTPTDEVSPTVTDTAPTGEAAGSVSTTSSAPVANPADTPVDQQPDATNAAPTPTTADEVAAPESTTVEPEDAEAAPAPTEPQS